MTVTTTNLIQGPALIFIGTFGVTEPLTVATAPGTGWVNAGGTKDGIELTITKEFAPLEVDQVIDQVGHTVVKRIVQVKTSLAEGTLANLAHALSETAPVGNVLEPGSDLAAFTPTYRAVLLDGIAPGGFRRRVIVRRVLSTDAVGVAYKKDGMTLVPVTFTGHYVSPTIRPYRIEDATV